MSVKDILLRQHVFFNQVLEQIDEDKKSLKQLAENMAECATNIRGQGYTTFIEARERFFTEFENITNDYCSLLKRLQ